MASQSIFLGKGDQDQSLLLRQANRHGLIAGATGTGKTVSLRILADVLGQLGNRIQHTLRAYTPKDQKAVRAAAQTFRKNPNLDTEAVIQELGIGEALVSTLDEKGVPTIVDKTLIIPPSSQLSPLSAIERQHVLDDSPLLGKYDERLDRDSAHERLLKRAEEKARVRSETPTEIHPKRAGRQKLSFWESITKTVVRSVGSSVGRQIGRTLLKSLFKK
jgi:DNA segregation ATPase FtsK/SpoIIIE-like protein